MNRSRRPNDDDFQGQLDAIDELSTIENRLRWLHNHDVEWFLVEKRRAELIRQIDAWDRRFASEDAEEHAQRGA